MGKVILFSDSGHLFLVSIYIYTNNIRVHYIVNLLILGLKDKILYRNNPYQFTIVVHDPNIIEVLNLFSLFSNVFYGLLNSRAGVNRNKFQGHYAASGVCFIAK